MDSMDVFESEAGSSSGLASQDMLPPSANQPVREPEADAAVELETDDIRDWLRTISSTMVSLQESFAQLVKQKKSKKDKRPPEVEFSSADER